MTHHEKERQQNNAIQEKMKKAEKTHQDQVASLSVQLNESREQLVRLLA